MAQNKAGGKPRPTAPRKAHGSRLPSLLVGLCGSVPAFASLRSLAKKDDDNVSVSSSQHCSET